MNDTPITIHTYPQAILHLDADAFFASVEQALDPKLRDRPVVTGQERGVIACANYEAKAQGVRRGIPLFQAKKICPDLVILPSDYETYGLFSKRMFNIIRRYTPAVEEYSVDEAFADITGLRQVFRTSYEEIAMRIQEEIQKEIGISVSIGLSLSKCLSKLCSKFRKPMGFTGVPGKYIHILLQRIPLENVWGFGPNTVSLLKKLGLHTAYDYVQRPERWAAGLLKKPGRDLWNELRGNSVWKVTTEEMEPKFTLLKSKTFTPATGEKSLVYAKLVRNVEAAFAKLRRHRLRATVLGIVLRHHNFRHNGLEAKLNRPTSSTLEALPLIRKLFERIFQHGCEYRATMFVLGGFENDNIEQFDFFEDRLKIESLRRATAAIDAINRRYGKHTISSGTALFLANRQKSSREAEPERRKISFNGEDQKKRLAIPRLGMKV